MSYTGEQLFSSGFGVKQCWEQHVHFLAVHSSATPILALLTRLGFWPSNLGSLPLNSGLAFALWICLCLEDLSLPCRLSWGFPWIAHWTLGGGCWCGHEKFLRKTVQGLDASIKISNTHVMCVYDSGYTTSDILLSIYHKKSYIFILMGS